MTNIDEVKKAYAYENIIEMTLPEIDKAFHKKGATAEGLLCVTPEGNEKELRANTTWMEILAMHEADCFFVIDPKIFE